MVVMLALFDTRITRQAAAPLELSDRTGATAADSGRLDSPPAPPQRWATRARRRRYDRPPRRPIPQEVHTRQRARDTMAATPQESSFGRGAIVRVKLFQFLTYEAVCFGVERVSRRRDSFSTHRWNSDRARA